MYSVALNTELATQPCSSQKRIDMHMRFAHSRPPFSSLSCPFVSDYETRRGSRRKAGWCRKTNGKKGIPALGFPLARFFPLSVTSKKTHPLVRPSVSVGCCSKFVFISQGPSLLQVIPSQSRSRSTSSSSPSPSNLSTNPSVQSNPSLSELPILLLPSDSNFSIRKKRPRGGRSGRDLRGSSGSGESLLGTESGVSGVSSELSRWCQR